MTYNRYISQNGTRRRLVVPDAAQSNSPAELPPRPVPPARQPTVPDLNSIGRMLKNILPSQLDKGDLLLIAVLMLLYMDSGDWELLIMLGALLFMK